MKKFNSFLLLIVIVFACESNEPQVLNESALQSVLSKSKTYEDIVNAMSSNTIIFSSFTDNEKKDFYDLAARARTQDFASLTEFAKVCEDIGFSAKHIDLTKSLITELKSRYIFDENDFNNILLADLNEKVAHFVASGRIKVQPDPFCTNHCNDAASDYRATLNPEMGNSLRNALRDAYYSGCFECCTSVCHES